MMKFLIAAIALLAAAPSASALTLVNPDGTPYTGWASRTEPKVPGPTKPIVVFEGACGLIGMHAEACTNGSVVYTGTIDNQFQHEIGHIVELHMNANDRSWFQRQIGPSPTGVNFEERFADLYSSCAVNGLMPEARGNSRVSVWGYGSSYTLIIYRRACRYLRYHTDDLAY